MKPLPLIVLLTDFGIDTPYVAQMKGVILDINPEARIIDLTHSISPPRLGRGSSPRSCFGGAGAIASQNITEAVFLLKTSYRYFPKGTVFVVVVDPGVGTERRLVCLTNRLGYFFLAPDNGVLSEIGDGTIREITNRKYWLPSVSRTFHGRDILAPVAAYLSKGLNTSKLGPIIKTIKRLPLRSPEITDRTIRGEVVWIDRFGNLITNIPEKLVKGRNYAKIVINIKKKIIRKISRTYADKKPGSLIALIGSSGYLELAVNQDSAKEKLKVKAGERMIIRL